MFGTMLLSRISFSAASANTCFNQQTFAAATSHCFHLFLSSACNCCVDSMFIIKWVKAWECNKRTKPINGHLCSSLMLLWKSYWSPFSLNVSREGAETGQLLAELPCPWLLGFSPAPSTHNSTLSRVLINVHTCWYICGHMHTQRHTRTDTCAAAQAERDKPRVISAAAPVHKQPAAASLMSCDTQWHSCT